MNAQKYHHPRIKRRQTVAVERINMFAVVDSHGTAGFICLLVSNKNKKNITIKMNIKRRRESVVCDKRHADVTRLATQEFAPKSPHQIFG